MASKGHEVIGVDVNPAFVDAINAGRAPVDEPGLQALIDAGRGATIRLNQLKLPIGRIDVQFLTHYHSDHVSCIADVWLTGWL